MENVRVGSGAPMVQREGDVRAEVNRGFSAVGREARSVSEGPGDHGPKILVVDDEQEILDAMVELISLAGYRVFSASNGQDALRIFNAEHPELVITDLSMPEMNGLELIEAVKAVSPQTEILILTAHSSVASAIDALRRGVFDYLTKPFDFAELEWSVKRALERFTLVSEKEALLRELEERVRLRTQALAESQRQLQAVFHGIGDALCLVDQNLKIVMANEGAGRWAGRPPAELVGRDSCWEIFGRDPGWQECPVRETIRFGRPCFASMSRLDPDGRRVDLEVSTYPLDLEGSAGGAVVHIRDVTEQARQRREIHNSEKLAAVGRLAAGLAHELGNALAIIGGSVQFLLRYPGDRRQASREYLEVIHRNVTATDRTIRELLAFARPTEPFLGSMDVTESLDRAYLLLRGEFAKHGVEVVQQYAPALPRIRGDSEQLQQVFLNLLLNAIQAMEDGGTITIRAIFDPPEWVRVELMDTGRGISEEHLDRIFDPFFTTREGGTGLGLSIAQRHVEAHQGRLTVESQEGKGTRFSIFLPAMAPEQVLARAE